MRKRQGICPNCGTERASWIDAKGKPLVPPPYEATTDICWGCVEHARVLEEMKESGALPGSKVVWVRPNIAEYDEQFWTPVADAPH